MRRTCRDPVPGHGAGQSCHCACHPSAWEPQHLAKGGCPLQQLRAAHEESILAIVTHLVQQVPEDTHQEHRKPWSQQQQQGHLHLKKPAAAAAHAEPLAGPWPAAPGKAMISLDEIETRQCHSSGAPRTMPSSKRVRVRPSDTIHWLLLCALIFMPTAPNAASSARYVEGCKEGLLLHCCSTRAENITRLTPLKPPESSIRAPSGAAFMIVVALNFTSTSPVASS